MAHEVFISHDSDDEHLAALLKDLLETVFSDFRVFVSGRDLRGGGVWPENLRTRLKEAEAIVALLTPRSVNNLWVHFEAGAGFPNSTTIPVCADGLRPSQLGQPFASLHARQLTEDGLMSLIDDLAQLAGYERSPGADSRVRETIRDYLNRIRVTEFAPASDVALSEAAGLPIEVRFADIEQVGVEEGFAFLIQHVRLVNRSAAGVTIANVRWSTAPTEVMSRIVTQHLESDGSVCVGFDTPGGVTIHEKRPQSDRWLFPADLQPGAELTLIVPLAVHALLEAATEVRTKGLSLTVTAVGSQDNAVGEGRTRVPLPLEPGDVSSR